MYVVYHVDIKTCIWIPIFKILRGRGTIFTKGGPRVRRKMRFCEFLKLTLEIPNSRGHGSGAPENPQKITFISNQFSSEKNIKLFTCRKNWDSKRGESMTDSRQNFVNPYECQILSKSLGKKSLNHLCWTKLAIFSGTPFWTYFSFQFFLGQDERRGRSSGSRVFNDFFLQDNALRRKKWVT